MLPNINHNHEKCQPNEWPSQTDHHNKQTTLQLSNPAYTFPAANPPLTSPPPVISTVSSSPPMESKLADFSIAHLFYCQSFIKAAIPQETAGNAKKISYAAVVHGVSTQTIHNPNDYPAPCVSDAGGGYNAVKVPQKIYEERLTSCRFSFIGRISLSKGEKPWRHPELKTKLNCLWGLNMDWKLISFITKGLLPHNFLFWECSAISLEQRKL